MEYHEEKLSQEAKDYHRAIKSMIEELEAIDWYNPVSYTHLRAHET